MREHEFETCSTSSSEVRLISISATNASTFLARDEGGALYCWGDNGGGQCDPNSIVVSLTQPVRVQILPCVTQAACDHTGVALDPGGHVLTWGADVFGLRGEGETVLDGVSLVGVDAVYVDVGNEAAAFVSRSGGVFEWGTVGDMRLSRPTRRELPFRATSVSVSWTFSCAVSDEGEVWCWGANGWGELGRTGAVEDAIRVNLPGPVSSVVVDAQFACAVADMTAYCWGRNNVGQVGSGALSETSDPSRVGIDGEVDGVAVGKGAACAWTVNGAVYCWGANSHWRLHPNDVEEGAVVRIEELEGSTGVAIGSDELCGLVNGRIRCRLPHPDKREFEDRVVTP